jgi:hypothetical protein
MREIELPPPEKFGKGAVTLISEKIRTKAIAQTIIKPNILSLLIPF